MENKNRYFKALTENNERLNEIDLGEKLGLDESETREIIVQLLGEHKIEYVENKTCSYKLTKISKTKFQSRI